MMSTNDEVNYQKKRPIPSQLLIVMAVKQESQGLIEKWCIENQVQLLFTGVGSTKSAAKLTEALGKSKVRHILNLGTAGSRKYAVGEVFECFEFVSRGTENGLSKKITLEPFTQLPKAVCASGDFVDQSKNANQFEIMDMEGFTLATTAQSQEIKFNSIKVVSDNSNSENDLMKLKANWEKNLLVCSKALHNFLIQTFD